MSEYYRGRYVIIALVILFFLFGFFLYKYPCRNLSEMKEYVKNKFIRMIGLYWIALIAFWIMYGIIGFRTENREFDGSILNLLQKAVGLQFLRGLSSYPAMWFMGTLMVYLIIYGMVSYLFKEKHRVIFVLIILVAPVYSLRAQRIITNDTYSYYMPFVAGIIAGYAYSLGAFSFKKRDVPKWLHIISYGVFATYLTHLIVWRIFDPLIDPLGIKSDVGFALFFIPLAIIFGFFFQYLYDELIVGAMKRIPVGKNTGHE